MARGESYFVSVVRRGFFIFTLIQLLFIAAFLFVSPALALLGGMTGAAILLGLLGLLFDFRALDILIGWTRGLAPTLQKLAALYHGGVTLTAIAILLVVPIDPAWTPVVGTEQRGDSLVTWHQGGLVIGSGSNNDIMLLTAGRLEPVPDYHGGPAWAIQSAPDGTLWVAPRLEAVLLERSGSTWTTHPRPPGAVNNLVPRDNHVWLVIDSRLHVFDRSTAAWGRPTDLTFVDSIAVAPRDEILLVTGTEWLVNYDSHEWIDYTPKGIPNLRYAEAAIGGGPWYYAFSGGVWSGSLYACGPKDPGFTPRDLPASDIRALVADPKDGRRIWIGTWGQGVYFSPDTGTTWQDLGLKRIQINTLAIDFTAEHPTIAVGGSNMIFDRGAFTRPLTP